MKRDKLNIPLNNKTGTNIFQTLQNSKFNNVDVLYDKDLMKSLFGDLKSISLSIKSSNCSSMIFAKYLLDGTVFIGDNIYGEAFNCLSKVRDALNLINEN